MIALKCLLDLCQRRTPFNIINLLIHSSACSQFRRPLSMESSCARFTWLSQLSCLPCPLYVLPHPFPSILRSFGSLGKQRGILIRSLCVLRGWCHLRRMTSSLWPRKCAGCDRGDFFAWDCIASPPILVLIWVLNYTFCSGLVTLLAIVVILQANIVKDEASLECTSVKYWPRTNC